MFAIARVTLNNARCLLFGSAAFDCRFQLCDSIGDSEGYGGCLLVFN